MIVIPEIWELAVMVNVIELELETETAVHVAVFSEELVSKVVVSTSAVKPESVVLANLNTTEAIRFFLGSFN